MFVRRSLHALARAAALLVLVPAVPASAQLPDDPAFDQQWGMLNSGQLIAGKDGGVPDADIDAPEAWSVTRGTDDVVVAIVDSGIAYDNPDLAPRIWRNAGELGTDAQGRDRRSNGVDDDGNGYVDDWRGWDVVGNSVLDPADSDNDPRDISGHGTHVAGIVGATGDNGIGVTGVNWKVRLMNVRTRGERSNETTRDIAEGFRYAARNGARIVNASLAWTYYAREVEDAMRDHPETLFIVAAGNRGEDLDARGRNSWPCEYDVPNLLCVAATDRDDTVADFSNRGATSVDLAAPGTITLSSHPAYGTVDRDSFEGDPFGSGGWLRGAAEGENRWGTTTEKRSAGTHSMTNNVEGGEQPGSDTWIETADPINLSGRQGCEVATMTWLSSAPGAGLYVQARGDRDFDRASREPAQDTPTPRSDTVAFNTGTLDRARRRVNISNLDGDPSVYLRFGVLAGSGAAAAPRAWLDDMQIRCLSSDYSSNGVGELSFLQGTSMATPHVSGVAALVAARSPGLSGAGIKTELLRAVDVLPTLRGRVATSGRINAYKAVALSAAGVANGVLRVDAGWGERNRFSVSRAVEDDGVARYRISDPWAEYGVSPMAGSHVVPSGGNCSARSDTAVACRARGVGSVAIDAGDLEDRVDSVDGVGQAVDCGPGSDIARVDQLDVVTECEDVTVERVAPVDTSADAAPDDPPPGGGPGGGGSGGGGPGEQPGGDSTPPELRFTAGRAVAYTRRARIRLRFGPVEEHVTGIARVASARRLRLGRNGRPRIARFGSRSFAAPAGTPVMVDVRLSKRERWMVRRLGSLRVRVTISLSDAAGNTTERSIVRTVRHRRAR